MNTGRELPATQPETSGLAIASLALSCLSVAIGPFGCIPGVICGHMARRQCRANPDVTGDGLAVAGLIVGYVFLAIYLASLLLFALFLVLLSASGAEPFQYTLF